ncbi:MAG: circadian clock protein KaiC [Planctomycetaceae bacterium]
MAKTVIKQKAAPASLPKCTTGIQGLDEITDGGLPKGRPTLVCGGAGCGKTLLGIEFLVRGTMLYEEPGVFIAFEETAEELSQNVRSLGFDLDDLIEKKKLAVDYIHIERSEIEETGEYDLEGLFIRLGYAIDSIGAKRVVLDTLETLFSGLSNVTILRAELRRLFRWLKEKGVTAIITAERGSGTLTRHGLEEYVSDCVLMLDHRVEGQISTRRLRVVKYRGSAHATNEFPFLIDKDGISILPITSLQLQHKASTERISSGVPALDSMLGGQGFFRGSSVLVSGTAGVGKTSLACHAADACCQRDERCLYIAFEESEAQLLRNMRSIGLDLEPWVKKGLLRFQVARPTMNGLEMHLASIHKQVEGFQPHLVIVDPITSFISSGTGAEATSMMMRLVDYLKSRQITALLTNLNHAGSVIEQTNVEISSLIDTWLLLRDIELNGERNRGLYILKSRGMAHSNQIREFLLTDHGVQLTDVYLGPEGVLTGSARLAQEAREQATAVERSLEIERKGGELARRQQALEAQIAVLQLQFQTDKEAMERDIAGEQAYLEKLEQGRYEMALSRNADSNGHHPAPKKGRK